MLPALVAALVWIFLAVVVALLLGGGIRIADMKASPTYARRSAAGTDTPPTAGSPTGGTA